MKPLDERKLNAAFRQVEEAVIAGERCPKDAPFGDLPRGAIGCLVSAGRVRSEVYRHNWRVVTLLRGPHKGKSTAAPPAGGKPYLVNGVHVDSLRRRTARIAP